MIDWERVVPDVKQNLADIQAVISDLCLKKRFSESDFRPPVDTRDIVAVVVTALGSPDSSVYIGLADSQFAAWPLGRNVRKYVEFARNRFVSEQPNGANEAVAACLIFNAAVRQRVDSGLPKVTPEQCKPLLKRLVLYIHVAIQQPGASAESYGDLLELMDTFTKQ